MISRSELIRKLKREMSPAQFALLSEDFINEILYDEALKRFSNWYWMLCDIRITEKDAIPYQDYTGRVYNFSTYRIPSSFNVPGIDSSEKFTWIDIEDYQIGGNDTTDVLTGGNFLLNSMFLNAKSSFPHNRSYYTVTFREPNLLIVNPPQQIHRNFNVTMKAYRTLSTLPRNMEMYFQQYFVALVKYYLYIRKQHDSGSQVFGGIEIDTKLDDFKDSESVIKEIEDIFEKDYYRNPETFAVQCLYQRKS